VPTSGSIVSISASPGLCSDVREECNPSVTFGFANSRGGAIALERLGEDQGRVAGDRGISTPGSYGTSP